MIKYLFLLIGMVFLSCSPSSFVLRQMNPVFENSMQAMYEEDDLVIAEQALASNLKLIEGILKSDPDNVDLLLMAAQGYAGYALGFAEDENPERAKRLYLRARDYALQILHSDPDYVKAQAKGLEVLQNYLNTLEKDQVPALFWAGFAWAGWANLSLDNPEALLALPEIQLMMQRVETLQADYFYGSVYLFFGGMYGMKPRMLGGDPDKAAAYFKKNFLLNEDEFLLAHVYAAKFYAAKILDEELFDSYIRHIQSIPVDIRPGLQLFNSIAKKKAAMLATQKDDLF